VSSTPGLIAARRTGGRRRRPGRTGRLGAVLGLTVGLSVALVAAPATGGAQAAPVPVMPSTLPTGIEDAAPYVGQVSCDPTAKPGTLALGRLLTATYSGTGYLVGHECGSDSIASEHVDGRALDWTVSARNATQKAQADAFLTWLLATDRDGRPFAAARRLGVMYVIWNNQIWSSHDPLPGWQRYSTCPSHPEPAADAVCHRSRLHLSLSWAGAQKRTSYWTGSVAGDDYGPCRPADLNWAPAYSKPNPTPCPTYPVVAAPSTATANAAQLVRYSGARVKLGHSGPVVSTVQKALGVTADGDFGPFTADAVAAFQTKHKLTATGAMDAATWRALLVATGGKVVAPTPKPVTTPTTGLAKYRNLVLKNGSHGAAVTALQKRLKVAADGWFGPKTRAAVIAFQKSNRLPATGIVNAATWTALGA
jgi:peptidoglycan hydrolase-like protein with peptidoglycan-binding domain